jgi:hypothetical protein
LSAFLAVFCSFLAMAITAWLGLWLLGADQLGDGTMPALTAAVVALGVGGKVELSGGESAGNDVFGDIGLASGSGQVDLTLWGVGLIGALVLGWLFVRPFHRRVVVSPVELVAHALRIAVFVAGGLAGVVALGKHDLPLGEVAGANAEDLMGIFDIGLAAKFTTDAVSTFLYGGVWLLLTLALALGVSSRCGLPLAWLRHRDQVRPLVAGVLTVLLGAVVAAVLGGPFVALAAPEPDRMVGGMLLALPTVVWLLLTLGLGVPWDASGAGEFSFGLPGPLGDLLRESGAQDRPVTITRLAELNSNAWWLPVFSGLLLLAGGFVVAVRSPAEVRPWQHAWRFGLTYAVTLLVLALVTQVKVKVAVEVLFGAMEPGGGVSVHAGFLWAVLLGGLCGALAGFLGGTLADLLPGRTGAVSTVRDPRSNVRR